jgi:hypothetical protein
MMLQPRKRVSGELVSKGINSNTINLPNVSSDFRLEEQIERFPFVRVKKFLKTEV